MRYLIDGYNVMYAGGLLGKRLGPDGFRKVRNRFLNDLADALGPIDAGLTTVVFDAADAPEDRASRMTHKGITVVFAVDDESADERIELMIGTHGTPKALTVVSTDRRIRQAATRRKALAVTADAFWVDLDARRERRKPAERTIVPAKPTSEGLSASESAYWQEAFRELEEKPSTREALNHSPTFLTDEEIAELEREIEAESG